MSVVTEPRRPRSRPPRRRRGGPLFTIAAIVGGLLVLIWAIPALVPSLNPFREGTVDRSGPVLRKSLENLSEYRAASANLQVVVDVERDAKLLPSFVKGERTLFVAAGSVDAAVDFSGLDGDAVRTDEDRKAVSIRLPAPELTDARLDPDRTRVYDRDRGLVDRVEDVFADNPADEQPLYQLAERKLTEAARADSELLKRAEDNTRRMLTGMMRGLGFERITVIFEKPRV